MPEADELLARIAAWQGTSGGEPVEVAFYGGTFTALTPAQQQRLLQPLQPLLATGRVTAIRVSTRPDAIDAATASALRAAGVSLVELGVQSMHDDVLAAAGRGHNAAAAVSAFAVLRSAGLRVGAQLMPGLPGEDGVRAIASFRRLMALKPDLLRIYPAVVLNGTGLAALFRQGAYRPLTLAAAVDCCKVMLHEAASAAVPVIRAGLQPTADLAAAGTVLAGPSHPAFRQLAEGERWFDLLRILTAGFGRGTRVTLHGAPAQLADIVGQQRRNIERLERLAGVVVERVSGERTLLPGAVRIDGQGRSVSGDILRDLTYYRETRGIS